jgi:hypothetical protein
MCGRSGDVIRELREVGDVESIGSQKARLTELNVSSEEATWPAYDVLSHYVGLVIRGPGHDEGC